MSADLHTVPLSEPLTSRPSALAPAEKRQVLGQFFSPHAVADLLASFVKFDRADVRMLEVGAGAGALIAATVRRACSEKNGHATSPWMLGRLMAR